MLKILQPQGGCNTASMYRVTEYGRLIAMFLSRKDAEDFIKAKQGGQYE